jgi:hypothetical protein
MVMVKKVAVGEHFEGLIFMVISPLSQVTGISGCLHIAFRLSK